MRGAVACLSVLAILAVSCGPALAGKQKTVTACSSFGNGCITAAVRDTPKGQQYRDKSGNWIWCGYTCAETLRVNTVDFWEDQDGLTGEGEGRLWARITR